MLNIATLTTTKPKYVPLVLAEETLHTKKMKRLSHRLRELLDMLEYCRPDDSATEIEFITKYIDTLPCVTVDGYGNRIIQIGKAKPKVCWASHTDTVHYDNGKQAIELNANGDICLDFYSKANCLGADCTAGVWLMRRMILAGKPGLYIFHRSEETGGGGSSYIATNSPELLKGIEFLISLDRRGQDSIVTKQFMGVTASWSFAHSIAPMLPGGMKADPTGTFTDSQNYSHLVSECSNLSVGYEHCHTHKETLDYRFIDNLLTHLLKLDYSKLLASRTPMPQDDWYQGANNGPCGYYSGGSDRDFNEQWSEYMANENKPADDPLNSGTSHKKRTTTNDTSPSLFYDSKLSDLVRRYPEATALLFEEYGIETHDLYEFINKIEELGQ